MCFPESRFPPHFLEQWIKDVIFPISSPSVGPSLKLLACSLLFQLSFLDPVIGEWFGPNRLSLYCVGG